MTTERGKQRPLTDEELREFAAGEIEERDRAASERAEKRALSPEARAARRDVGEALDTLRSLEYWTMQLAAIDLATVRAELAGLMAQPIGLGLSEHRIPSGLSREATRDAELLVEQMRDNLDNTIEHLRDVRRRLGRRSPARGR